MEIEYNKKPYHPQGDLSTVIDIAESLGVDLKDIITVFLEHGILVSIYQRLDKETEEFIRKYYENITNNSDEE